MNEFMDLILGEASVAYYAAAEFFALIALVISLLMHSRTRDKSSTSTPENFSWGFLIWDNFKRIVCGQLMAFILFRFSVEILGRELNMYWAFGIGFFLSFGSDKLFTYLKEKFNFLDMPRKPQ
jgi:hypothetical protein